MKNCSILLDVSINTVMNVYRVYFHEITLENLFVLLDHVKTFIQNKITRILKCKL